MNLINCTYFHVGPLQIQNARAIDDLDTNAIAVNEHVTAYIERYQEEYLENMLGEELAKEVIEYLNAPQPRALGPIIIPDEPAKSDMEELCDRLKLPFAHYVYFKLVGDVNQTMTITGLMKLKSANDNQPPRQRMVKVWNEMVDLHKKFVKWAETSSFNVFYRENMVTYINQYNL